MTIQLPSSQDAENLSRIISSSRVVVRLERDREAVDPQKVTIGPFEVDDLSQAAVVETIVGVARTTARRRTWVGYALHVGGLNERGNRDYVRAMANADCVYADGISVVLLAKLAGAQHIERAGTTDIGWDVLRRLSAELGRPARVALLGGPEGLARRALAVLEAEADVVGVAAEHGYHDDWAPVLARLATSRLDILLVGLGAPLEMEWVERHRDRLPHCVVLTCGGWFGFVVSEEKRAPRWMRNAGLEWSFRLIQAPRRLLKRYALGMVSTVGFGVLLCVERALRLSTRVDSDGS
jgi:N-acetylglucosaminyldiphosphoundecaprenol N-acetyl-beta-D-mannosaminyltransferase